MNKAASQLGKLAAGVPKKFSASELAKRTARLKAAQKNRAKTQRALRHSNDPDQLSGDSNQKPK